MWQIDGLDNESDVEQKFLYQRLIIAVATERNIARVETLIEIYNAWISPKIDDYNSSMYFENTDYLLQSYLAGEALRD
jgi:CRISPR/Cas system CSM-associated protein Csm2 small subunit